VFQQTLIHDDAFATFWVWYYLSDGELLYSHLKSIGVKRDKLKFFMDLDNAPDGLVFKGITAGRDIVLTSSLIIGI
jgi:hypothetical protein